MDKGMEITLSTLVTAALAVVALIVLVMIGANKFGLFARHTDDCYEIGGQCVEVTECKFPKRAMFSCGDEGKVCCGNPCLADGGSCEQPCLDDEGCENKCPEETQRSFLSGCNEGEVCCKPK